MTDDEREQLEKIAANVEYLARKGVYFTHEDKRVIVGALNAIGQAHNAAMFQNEGII